MEDPNGQECSSAHELSMRTDGTSRPWQGKPVIFPCSVGFQPKPALSASISQFLHQMTPASSFANSNRGPKFQRKTLVCGTVPPETSFCFLSASNRLWRAGKADKIHLQKPLSSPRRERRRRDFIVCVGAHQLIHNQHCKEMVNAVGRDFQ